MPKHPIIPPGFEHLYPLRSPTSAGLTKPNPQPGLKIETQELASDEPRTAHKSQSGPKLSAKVRVGKPGTSRKRAAVGKSSEVKRLKNDFGRLFSEVKDEIALLNGMIRFADKYKCSFCESFRLYFCAAACYFEMDKSIVAVDESHRRNESVASGSKCSGSLVPINSIAIDINCAVEEIESPKHEHFSIYEIRPKTGMGVEEESEWHELRKAESGVHLKMTELIRTKTDVLNA